ncbi:MAG: M20 family metallopeptidase [Acidaminococcaceae bacterium]
MSKDIQKVKELVFSYIDAHRSEMMGFWEKIVSMESGSAYKDDVDKLGTFLGEQFEAAGAEVRFEEFEKAGNMLIANIGNERVGEPIILMGHFDTVFPVGTLKTRPFKIEEGKAYGPGVLDMKGGITILYFIVRALQEAGYDKRPLKILLAGDEEVGHSASTCGEIFINEAKGAKAAFDFETGYTDNGIVVGRKGQVRIYVTVHGLAAHAGNEPEKGRNAILEMAHKVIGIQALTDWEKGITYNVGIIKGGTVMNAVPDCAYVEVDVRYIDPAHIELIKESVNKVVHETHVEGTTTEVSFEIGFQPMQTTEGVKELFALMKGVAEREGFGELKEKFVGGGADSAYAVIAGVPTLCAVGVMGGRNHSPEEFAVVETLFTRAKLLAATILELN